MERIVSPEERLRRAEEIYYRRRAQGVRVSTTTVNVGKNNKISLGKKMIIQIIVCILIYSAFWVIKGYNNVFSSSFINETRKVLAYDINFVKLYNESVEYFNKNFNSIIKKEDENKPENADNTDEVNTEQNTNEEKETNNQTGEENNVIEDTQNDNNEGIENNDTSINNESKVNSNEGVGGGEEEANNVDGTIKAKEDATNMDQMHQDAEFVKSNYSIIKPIEGYITSGFGEREQTEIISAFHQGIDIGAALGTPIYAGMEGDVVASSFAGDYGNHIKIQNGEVLTVYAHCSELEVNVGDHIAQGQEIGKVGATGKVTRTTFTLRN